MTPICCDEPVSFIQPVFRNPKRKTNAAAVERNFNQKIQEQDDMDNSKRKRDTTTSTDDDEDIMCWSGPPKKPRSPIKCTEEIFATNATFRQPRKRQSTSTSKTATAGSNDMNRDSGQRSSSNSEASEQQRSYGDGQSDNIHQDRQGAESSHMPPRDPLCHVPKVTPPCPIVPDDRATPAELRTYTHVSSIYIVADLNFTLTHIYLVLLHGSSHALFLEKTIDMFWEVRVPCIPDKSSTDFRKFTCSVYI
jgi:DNA mismatch repair ATPase MutL